MRKYRYRCHWSDNGNQLGAPVKAHSGEQSNLPFVYITAANLTAAKQIVAQVNSHLEPTSGPHAACIPRALLKQYGFEIPIR